MIPVFGVPILNKPDLLNRLFSTVDYGPIDRLYIIDNGGCIVPSQINWPTHVNGIHVTDPGFNMGVAASWNLIIRANIDQPWWLFVNNDLTLESGALHRLVDDMEAHSDIPYLSMIEMGNESWGNHFGAHAINAAAVDKVGWFDENFHPIYFEDTDWKRRAERLGLAMNVVRSTTHHDGNRSWADVPHLAEQNKNSWKYNVEYFDSKWSNPSDPVYPEDDMRTWPQPSVERLRATAWKNVRTRENNLK